MKMDNVNRFALPGVRQKTSAKDRFIISQMQLIRYTHPDWQLQGTAHRGAPSLTPLLRVTGTRGRETGL